MTTNLAIIQELESTIQALRDTLQPLQNHHRVYNWVVRRIHQHQEESNRLSLILNGNGNPQSPQGEDGATSAPGSPGSSAASMHRRGGTPNTTQDRLQEVEVLESVLENVENRHARLLLLALKLEIEAEVNQGDPEN